MKHLTLRHDMNLEALSLGTALAPLLHHYRTAPTQSLLANRIELSLELSYPGDPLAHWTAAPNPKETGYFRAVTLLSVEIQKALRAWIGCLWNSQLDNLRDTERTTQVAAYLALRPHYPKSKNALGYDALEDISLGTLQRSLRTHMADALGPIATQLRLLGEHDLADFYSPSHATWFADNAVKTPKLLLNLLAREHKMIRVWAPCPGQGIEEKRLEEVREEIAMNLRGMIRRDDDWRFLTAAVEIEATTAMEAYLERVPQRRLYLQARPEDGPLAATSPRLPARVIEFPSRQKLAA